MQRLARERLTGFGGARNVVQREESVAGLFEQARRVDIRQVAAGEAGQKLQRGSLQIARLGQVDGSIASS
jgi:hypothetical protein